jgi:hypothetical protein
MKYVVSLQHFSKNIYFITIFVSGFLQCKFPTKKKLEREKHLDPPFNNTIFHQLFSKLSINTH